jgi:outer membrane protein
MTRLRDFQLVAATAILALAGAEVRAQERLSLAQAIEATLSANPEVAAARAAIREAEQRQAQARARFLPRVDFTQSWQRGDQPIFVFGSLLAQRQFAEADFALQQLNHPEAMTNARSAFSMEQTLFDGGAARTGVRAASLAAAIAEAGARRTRQDLVLAATRAYGRILHAGAVRRTAESAVAAAEANARIAQARRDAGTGTEADLLAMRVHLAQMQARAVRAASEGRIARAELNRLMHVALDRDVPVDEPTIAGDAPGSIDAVLDQALRQRPEIQQATLQRDLNRILRTSAKGALLPQVVVQGGYEWNDGRRGAPAAAWVAGAIVRLNLFDGGASVARVREAASAADRATAEHAQTEATVRMEVLTAFENLTAARARESIGRAMVAESRESERMIRDRYEAGIAPVSDAIRAATAVLDAEAERIDAVVDIIIGQAALRRAIGSEVNP